MALKQPIDVKPDLYGDEWRDEVDAMATGRVKVDQPTRAPTRKLQAATAGAGISGAVALLAVEALQQVDSLAFLSEGGWQAVSYIVAAGVAGLGAFAAGYPVRDYEA